MSEEFGCRQVFGDGTAVDGDERLVGPFAQLVDAVSDIFLARATGSVDEYRHGGRCYQTHVTVELAGCFALSFQIIVRILECRLGFWLGGCRSARLRCFQCFLDFLQQDVRLDGFRYIVACSLLYGLHGTLDVGVAGHNDERHQVIVLAHPLEEEDAVLVGEAKVGQYQIVCTGIQLLARTYIIADGVHLEPFLSEPRLQDGGEGQVIFYD